MNTVTQLMAIRLDENMEKVLDVFYPDKTATTGFIIDETGLSRPTVTKRLDRLHAGDYIEYLHEGTALWKLRKDPRETNEK